MTDTLHHMFALGLPIAEKVLRPVVVYVFLIAGLRLAGKRELAQLNPFDLIVLLTLSNTVQNAIIGDDNTITGGVLGASALLSLNYCMVPLHAPLQAPRPRAGRPRRRAHAGRQDRARPPQP